MTTPPGRDLETCFGKNSKEAPFNGTTRMIKYIEIIYKKTVKCF